MSSNAEQIRKRLGRKTKRGFRGFPTGTVAFYGPDDSHASKVVATIVESEDREPEMLSKWFDDNVDVRHSDEIMVEVEAFLDKHQVVSVAMMDRIIGCPHEEGIDYEGPTCPECPFWAYRDRWTGDVIQ